MSLAKSIGVVFTIALSWLFVAAQTPQPTPSPEMLGPAGTGIISGHVVDENEQPVPNAQVQIGARPSTPNNPPRTVLTNRNGEFSVTGLPPVDYSISVRAAAYLSGPNEPLRPNSVYRIGDSVRLRMIKGGVVTGKVSDENGRPVVGVGVRAQMVRDPHGRLSPKGPGFEKATDDRGIYRIYGLWPGTYVVAAGGPDSRRFYERTTYELDVPTYAPASGRDTATEYKVQTGEEISDIDIRYRGEQGRMISGDVTVPSNLHTGFSVVLMSGDAAFPLFTTSNQGSGKGFVFKGVGDGEYQLIAQSSSSDGELAISEAKPLSVRGADVSGIQLTAKLLGSVSGRVVLNETKVAECGKSESPLASTAFVFASSNENEVAKSVSPILQNLWSMGDPVRLDSEGKFLLQNIIPGPYHFGLNFKALQWYVSSIAFPAPAQRPPGTARAPVTSAGSQSARTGTVDVTRIWTNVKGNERLANLTIMLTHGAAALRGGLVLAEGEQVPPRLTVYLVPVEPAKANDVLRFYAEPVQANGYIGVDNIAPGRYWILAQPAEGVDSPRTKIRLPDEAETRKRLRRDAEALKNEIEIKPCQNVMDFKLSLKPATQN